MTLGDLTLPISYEVAKGYALVFTPALAARLSELHGQYGSDKCKPTPRQMTDGRLMLRAVLLTEVMPGGLLAVHDEFCNYEAVAATLPSLLASGVVEEISEDEYRASLPSGPPG